MKRRIAAIMCIFALSSNYSVFAEENIFFENIELSEENEEIITENTIKILSVSEEKEKLRNLLGYISVCNPEVAASSTELEAYNAAKKEAELVLADESADEGKVSEATKNLENAVKGLKYIVKETILTNNNFTNVEEYYPGIEIPQTGVTYTYAAGDNLAAADTEKNKLSDGKEENIAGETETSQILYDLGKEYYITGVDVYSQRTSGSRARKIKGFDVEVSKDGNDFNKVLYKEATGTDQNLRTDGIMPAVCARYVKISVYKAEDALNYNLREIVIKGFEYKFSKDDLYSVIAACYGVKKNRCSEESYNTYINAFNEAERIYWDESISGREITDAKDNLKKAFDDLEYINDTAILSGNVKTEDDKNYYSSYRIDTVSGIKYWYADNCDENVTLNSDPNCTKLLQGVCNITTSSGTVAEGVYGSNSPELQNRETIVAVFDLGENCYVNGVDVWEWYRTAQHIGRVVIEVSEDNITYRQVSEAENQMTSASSGISNNISQDFSETVCRYVRVTAYRVIKSMINEVVIKGFKLERESQIPYVFGSFDYKNASGERVRTTDGGIVKVSGKIENNNSSYASPCVITVAYDENNMLVAWGYTPSCTGAFENVLDLKGKTNVRLYSFIIDSIEGGIPLSEKKSFGKI